MIAVCALNEASQANKFISFVVVGGGWWSIVLAKDNTFLAEKKKFVPGKEESFGEEEQLM